MRPPAIPAPLASDTGLPVGIADPLLDTPALIVDLNIVESNLGRWASLARSAGLALRPHVKTHKSAAMAQRQLRAGAVGVTASSVTEAEAMVTGGVTDVTIAYPLLGPRKLERLAALVARGVQITLVADSDAIMDGYRAIARAQHVVLPVLIEIDSGMHRIGATADAAGRLAAAVSADSQLRFAGIMTHAGHAHQAAGRDGIRAVARAEAAIMADLRRRLVRTGLDPPVVSAGSTLTAPFLTHHDGITEIRPGTYIYNDLRTLLLGACEADQLAAAVVTTVIGNDGATRVTVDAGSKTLTATSDSELGYGLVPAVPGARVARMSEEHGVLEYPQGARLPAVGERLNISPVHVCPCVDLQPEVYGVRDGEIRERITVDAMRHSL